MPFGPHTGLLADMDWLDMLLPIAIMVVYGAVALAKGYAGRLKDKDRTEATSSAASVSDASKPRYKPLDEVAVHRTDSPQARTLPYARTAAQTSSSTPEPQRQPVAASQPTDWQRQSGVEQRRQQDVEQRRLKQTEAISRQKSKQEQLRQRQRQIQQQAIQSVKAVQAAVPKAISSNPLLGGGRAAQERRRQTPPGNKPAPAAKRPVPARSPQPTVVPLTPTSTSAALRKMLRTPQNLRTAMVLREILDKPAAFRD